MDRLKFASLLFVSLIIVTGIQATEKYSSFTAVQVETHPNGNERPGQNIYVNKDRIRIVMAESPMDTGSAVFLFMKDLKKIYTLFPEKKLFIEESWKEDWYRNTFKIPPENAKLKEISKEKVAGFECQVYSAEYTVEAEGEKITQTATIWKSPQFEFPLKVKTAEGFVFELRSIKIESAEKMLFEVPSDFKAVKTLEEALAK